MKIEITKDVLKELLSLERAVTLLPLSEQFKELVANQRKKTLMSDLAALSKSLELSFSEKELRKIYSGQEVNINEHPQRIMRNSISVMKYISSQKDSPFNLATIQHINKLLCDGYVEFWEEGKLIAANERPSLDHDSFRNRPNEFSRELFNQVKFINASDAVDHPIIKGISLLYHMLLSYPFAYFNLQTALLGFYGLTRTTDYSLKGAVSVLDAACTSINKLTIPNVPEIGLQTFTLQVLHCLNEQIDALQTLIEQKSTIPQNLLKTLNDRQIKALGLLKRKSKLSRRKYAQLNNIGIATAFRDLKHLLDIGLITSQGNGRGTFYLLNNFAVQIEEDTKVTISSDGIESYDILNSIDEIL